MSRSDSDFLTLDDFDVIATEIQSKTSVVPQVGLILGSGLGGVAEAVQSPTTISTEELPGWPKSTVEGHAGRLIIGQLEGQAVAVVQGRVHLYEGHPIDRIGMPVRVLQRIGAEILIVTNAAGGLDPEFERGDLMLITDHINLPGMSGHSPLVGPNLDQLGPRFPDMSQAYDRELQELARSAARDLGMELREGVYFCLAGPSFETPAELRFLRMVGADAVGMSTAHEVTAARHGGMRTLGFSGITNKASLDGEDAASHEEVLEAGLLVAPKLERLIKSVLGRL